VRGLFLSVAVALLVAACGVGSDDRSDAEVEEPVERPTQAELDFTSSADMFAAFDDFVVGVDSGGISEGPEGVTIDRADARVLDLTEGSVAEIDLPGTGHVMPLALHGDAAGAVIVIVDCPVEPAREMEACDDPSYKSYRLTGPSTGWAELDLGLDAIAGEPIGVSSMAMSAEGLTMVIRAQEGDRTFGVLVVLEGDRWRGQNGLTEGTTEACRTSRFTYLLVHDAPDTLGITQPVVVQRLGGTRDVLTIDVPPVAELFGAPQVALGCDADGAVLVSGRVGDEPPMVYEFGDDLGRWRERSDLVGGETLSFPPVRSAPAGAQLTWSNVTRPDEPFPTTVTVTARVGDAAVNTVVPIDAVVVPRPSNGDLVFLPGPPCDEPESCADPSTRLTEVRIIDPYL